MKPWLKSLGPCWGVGACNCMGSHASPLLTCQAVVHESFADSEWGRKPTRAGFGFRVGFRSRAC